jgi:hypothetical protein
LCRTSALPRQLISSAAPARAASSQTRSKSSALGNTATGNLSKFGTLLKKTTQRLTAYRVAAVQAGTVAHLTKLSSRVLEEMLDMVLKMSMIMGERGGNREVCQHIQSRVPNDVRTVIA